jgi:hypothetical protein
MGGVPPNAKRTPAAQIVGRLGEFGQQPLARFRRQAIGDAHQSRILGPRRLEHALHRRGRSQEQRPPTGCVGQAQEAQHPGHVDAFAQRGSHHDLLLVHLYLRHRARRQPDVPSDPRKLDRLQDEYRGAVHGDAGIGRIRLGA